MSCSTIFFVRAYDHQNLTKIERKALMQDAASALNEFQRGMYTGCDLNRNGNDKDFLVDATGEIICWLEILIQM